MLTSWLGASTDWTTLPHVTSIVGGAWTLCLAASACLLRTPKYPPGD
ncbi:MAG: hypothetical protein M1281_00160 [Chloroflexi bacterium]|nr:hypothetical protein [Chloroflexota bacterium]